MLSAIGKLGYSVVCACRELKVSSVGLDALARQTEIVKGENDAFNYIKFKTFQNTSLKKRRYLQNMKLTKGFFPECMCVCVCVYAVQ